MSEGKTKEYSNGEITVIWKPDVCIHSGNCVKGSPDVFNPKERPWVKPDESSSKQIMQTIDTCPSGALFYRIENESLKNGESKKANGTLKIKATKNGPFLINAPVEIEVSSGEIKTSEGKTTALCRCGASSNKPFCDGSHTEIDFKD